MNMAKAHAEAIPNCPYKNAMPGSPQAVRHCAILTRLFSAAELAHQLTEQQHKAHHQQNDGEDQTKEDKGKAVGLFHQRGMLRLSSTLLRACRVL